MVIEYLFEIETTLSSFIRPDSIPNIGCNFI